MRSLIIAATAVIGLAATQASAATLDTVKGRNAVQCGVSTGVIGFSSPDDKGVWTGIDVDLCRGIAAAIFNDPQKVKFVPLTAKDPDFAKQIKSWHELGGTIGYWLIGLHAVAGLAHHYLIKDNTLLRMLPGRG